MNLLITGAWMDGKEYITELEKLGNKVMFQQYEIDELICDYEWVDGVICNGLFLNHSIEKFVNLKYIQLTSAGFDRVPMEYVQRRQICIYNARGVYSIPMAEFVLASVLQVYKKMEFFKEKQKQHEWNKHRELLELYEKTVCIVGCGNVGTECAKRFQAFGCRVLGVDIQPRKDAYYSRIEHLNKIDAIIEKADVIVLTLPLTEETKYLIDESRLCKMKKDAILVNISRGAIIDIKALLRTMDNLGGVILDVFEKEPLEEESLLWDEKKVIITPHNSFVGDGNKKRMKDVVIENIEKYLKEIQTNESR